MNGFYKMSLPILYNSQKGHDIQDLAFVIEYGAP